MRLFKLPIILFLLSILYSCQREESEHQDKKTKLVKNDQTLYKEAIIDASVPEQKEIAFGLAKLTKENPFLEWKDESVKVVTWTSWDGYLALVDSTITTTRDTWVTPAPSLESFAEKSQLATDSLILSMEQLLGIPSKSGKKYFVTIWVNPSNVFRPCLDPEVTDDHCEVSLDKIETPIDSAHIAWIENLRASSYDTLKGYPWTQLGYTYDWADNGTEIGLSEFVIKPNSSITIDKVETLAQFIQ